MQFSKSLLNAFLLASGEIVRQPRAATREIEHDRRYFQLSEMMTHYNPEFDERKYWTYGCNCHVLGDRPMSDPGFGPPVDKLDVVCKAYKDCNKCARMEYGDSCIGEFILYKFGYKNGEINCKNPAGSCERALCECDSQFARQHVKARDAFDVKYHSFWAQTVGAEWDARDNCPGGGGGAYDPQCCTNTENTTPFILYNAVNKKCCADGSVSHQC